MGYFPPSKSRRGAALACKLLHCRVVAAASHTLCPSMRGDPRLDLILEIVSHGEVPTDASKHQLTTRAPSPSSASCRALVASAHSTGPLRQTGSSCLEYVLWLFHLLCPGGIESESSCDGSWPTGKETAVGTGHWAPATVSTHQLISSSMFETLQQQPCNLGTFEATRSWGGAVPSHCDSRPIIRFGSVPDFSELMLDNRRTAEQRESRVNEEA